MAFWYLTLAAALSAVRGDNTPVVLMHGMGDFAKNPLGMVPIKNKIAELAKSYVHSVEICSEGKLENCAAEDQSNGFFMTMDQQVDQFARVVRADPQLKNGFNAMGMSQGNTLIRGYIEMYNDPPVKKFVSLHGPMLGVAGLPRCNMNGTLSWICKSVDSLAAMGAYTEFVQDHLAQANYLRDPKKLDEYRKGCQFLPYLNNEVDGKQNATLKSNFASLEKLVLVMAEDDTMVQPKVSEHFGFFKDGSETELITMEDAPWYTENWFGLKDLNEAKKIDFFSTPGDHLRFTMEFLEKMVTTYFTPVETFVI
jgi:palmitoyl-protein thioesterase